MTDRFQSLLKVWAHPPRDSKMVCIATGSGPKDIADQKTGQDVEILDDANSHRN